MKFIKAGLDCVTAPGREHRLALKKCHFFPFPDEPGGDAAGTPPADSQAN